MVARFRLRLAGLVGIALGVGGCLIISDDTVDAGLDDEGFDTGVFDGGDLPGEEFTLDANDGDDDDDDDDDDPPDPDEESGDPPLECGGNVLSDGGFELGTPNAAWDEASVLFGTPICDDGCSPDPGAEPFAGDWFAWFGGATEPDVASLSQAFSVEAQAARLTFQFAVNAGAGSGEDIFAVRVDANTVFMVTDADMAGLEDYTEVTLTLDQYADGMPHTLRFESDVLGDGLTNFFVDEVSLVGCDDEAPTGTSGTTGTTDGGTDSTSTGVPLDDSGGSTDEGTTSSGSSAGGSTDSGTTDGGTTDGGTTDGGTTDGGTTGTTDTAGPPG